MQSGEQHAHIYGRKGDLIGVLTTDGSRTHGCQPFTLSDEDADELRRRGFSIPIDNLVEWKVLRAQPHITLLSE
jgi:hypothetical protein